MRRFAVCVGIFVGMLCVVFAGVRNASAGPVIIDGTDSNDHGHFLGGANQEGWKYMQEALEHLAQEVYTGTARVVVDLGTTPDPACSDPDGDARDAINSAFNNSSLPGQGWTLTHIDSSDVISGWLRNLSPDNTGILYVPTYNNLCGDLAFDEIPVINANVAGIVNFVNGPGDPTKGGALFSMSERNLVSGPGSTGAYLWLQTIIPGFSAAGFGNHDTPITLTLDGMAAFPGLTNADVSTGPWHNWFEGNFGSLNTLAVSQDGPPITRTVILGGGAGTRFGPKLADLTVTKVDHVLGGNGGVAAPGDTLVYTITLKNIDNSDTITGVTFTDAPGANTTLVVGSVSASQGSIISGNLSGDTSVNVDVGSLTAGSSAVIVFRATIANPLPAGVRQVANQGFASLPGNQLVRSDDPDTPVNGDPTVTPVTDKPVISASKIDWLVADADIDGKPSAGDTLGYTITVANNGVTATQVTFIDIPDPYTKLVVGSVTTTRGAIVLGNTAGDTSVRVNIGDLGGGHGQVVIAFRVTVDQPLPNGLAQVANQGIVTSNEVPTVLTDDPDTVRVNDPTETPLTLAPSLEVTKRAVLFTDVNGDGKASPGDELLYEISIANNGNAAATSVMFRDTPDPNTDLITGSVTSSGGSVLSGNNPGDTLAQVDVGTVPGGHGTVEIQFHVRINDPLAPGVTRVSNQGVLTSTQTTTLLTDDPDTAPVGDPTVTVLDAPGLLTGSKIAALFEDADNNLVTSPGDTLLYAVRIANIGGQVVSNVVYIDNLDPNTNLVVNSVQATTGTVTSGNNPGDTSVRVDIGSIPGGQMVDITYRAMITNPMPQGVITVSNQGVISSTGGITTTDDPDTPDDTPTVVTVTVPSTPVELQLSVVSDAPQCVLPGSSYHLTWTVNNIGDVAFPGGVLSTVVTGSGSAPLTATLGAIPSHTVDSVTQTVSVSQPVAYGAEAITVTGNILTSTAALTTLICAPDWRTSYLTTTSEFVFAHEELTYTWHIRNTGDADAINARAAVTLSSNPLVEFHEVISVTSGITTLIGPDNQPTQLVWQGDVPAGQEVIVVYHIHSVFGLPNLDLEVPFEITHPWRPPFYGLAQYRYPYKLFFMLVLRGSAPVR